MAPTLFQVLLGFTPRRSPQTLIAALASSAIARNTILPNQEHYFLAFQKWHSAKTTRPPPGSHRMRESAEMAGTRTLPTLLQILLGYLAAAFVAVMLFDPLLKAVSEVIVAAMKQTPYWPPIVPAGDHGPPLEMFNLIWLTALFLSSPSTAHLVRRRWFPSLDWRSAQTTATIFIAAGLLGHFAIVPFVLRHYPFQGPLVAGHTTSILFTIHTWTVLLTGTILATPYTCQKRPI